jgi:hypothetical protein
MMAKNFLGVLGCRDEAGERNGCDKKGNHDNKYNNGSIESTIGNWGESRVSIDNFSCVFLCPFLISRCQSSEAEPIGLWREGFR